MTGDVEQLRLVLGRGRAGHGADLGVADFAALERCIDRGQLLQGAGHADLFPGHQLADAAFPAQPVGQGADPGAGPALLAIELLKELEEPVLGGVEVTGQGCDLGGERLPGIFSRTRQDRTPDARTRAAWRQKPQQRIARTRKPQQPLARTRKPQQRIARTRKPRWPDVRISRRATACRRESAGRSESRTWGEAVSGNADSAEAGTSNMGAPDKLALCQRILIIISVLYSHLTEYKRKYLGILYRNPPVCTAAFNCHAQFRDIQT